MALKLDKTLHDTYRQYKAEEKTLVDWFVRTSQKCSGTVFFKNGRTSPTKTGSLPIYDILPMVQVIANHPSVEHVPYDIVNILRSVTLKRAQCSLWYKNNTKQGDVETQRLNRTHDYPLAVLRKTADLLKGKLLIPSRNSAKVDSEPVKRSPLTIANYFANLGMEDYVDMDAMSPVNSRYKEDDKDRSNSPDTSSSKRRHDALINETMMLRYCLLEHMEALEAMVIQEWTSFLTGSQSLLGASIITNHAVCLITQLESDAYRALDKHATEVGQRNPLASIQSHGLSGCFKSDERGQFRQPFIRMQHVLSSLWSRPDDKSKAHYYYRLIKDLDYFAADINDQRLYEMATIAEIKFSHGECMIEHDHNHPEAQSIRLFAWLQDHPDIWCDPERIPLSVAFAARVEVLVHYMLHDKAEKEHLRDIEWCDEAIDSLQEYLKLVNSKISLIDRFQTNVHEFWVPKCNCTIENLEGAAFKTIPDRELVLWTSTIPLHKLSARNMYLGVMIGSVMNVHTFELLAYLHDMCKSEDIETEKWPDLDFLEQYHEAVMYSGSKPSKGPKERYGNRMDYECGLSTQWRSTARGLALSTRWVGQRTPVIDPFSLTFPLTVLTAARAVTHDIYEGSTEQIGLLLRGRVVQEMLGEVPKHAVLEIAKFAMRGNQLRPTHALALVRHRLREELQHSDFDFIALYKGCLHLASMLGHHWQTNEIHEDLEKGKLYSAHDIARTVAKDVGTSIQSALTCSSLCCRPGARPKVEAVSRIFNEWVAKKGDVGLKRVERYVLKKPKHIRTLPLSFRLKLKEIHKKYGTMDDLFTPEQRKGIKWLDQTIVLKDVIQEEFGKKARNGKNTV